MSIQIMLSVTGNAPCFIIIIIVCVYQQHYHSLSLYVRTNCRDGGDCCGWSCEDGQYRCGISGYQCMDPNEINIPSLAPSRPPPKSAESPDLVSKAFSSNHFLNKYSFL